MRPRIAAVDSATLGSSRHVASLLGTLLRPLLLACPAPLSSARHALLHRCIAHFVDAYTGYLFDKDYTFRYTCFVIFAKNPARKQRRICSEMGAGHLLADVDAMSEFAHECLGDRAYKLAIDVLADDVRDMYDKVCVRRVNIVQLCAAERRAAPSFDGDVWHAHHADHLAAVG